MTSKDLYDDLGWLEKYTITRQMVENNLDQEILRTKGCSLNDFDDDDVDDLVRIFQEVKNIRKAVEVWSFS